MDLEHLVRSLPAVITIVVVLFSLLARGTKAVNRAAALLAPPAPVPAAPAPQAQAPPQWTPSARPSPPPPIAMPRAPARQPAPPPPPRVAGLAAASQEQAITALFLTPQALAAAVVGAEVLGPPLSLRER
jgi:hypothetical protein